MHSAFLKSGPTSVQLFDDFVPIQVLVLLNALHSLETKHGEMIFQNVEQSINAPVSPFLRKLVQSETPVLLHIPAIIK